MNATKSMSRNGAFEYDVFVSHNSRDKPRVAPLAERLREAGLRVWYDDWILTAGSNIYLEIERGIEASRTLALCMSSHAFDSDWVDLERSTVLFRDPANRGRSFIPILLDDCDVPDTLRRYKYVDYRHDSEEAVQELVAACRTVAEPGTPAPAALPTPEPDLLAGARPTATTHLFLGHLPATGRDLFGRERELRQLDEALADPQIHVCVLAAWGGAGKSTLVNHWVRRIAEEPSPPRIYAWSFHRQGTAGGLTSADLFMESALKWFGDPDPGQGSSWARGERLARLVRKQPTLLLLDGLEPLQWPPGPDEGKLKDPAVTALLRVLATRNSGLCVITSRLSVSDLEDCYGSTVLEINLKHVEPEAGAMILKAQGARGDESQLRQASTEFDGHCLALTILGSYLADAFDGDILRRTEVGPLMEADRHGGQARRIMASYEALLEENQRAVLRLLGLFDRPADAPAIAALRQPPAIAGLTEPLQDVSDREWRKLVAGLRRSQLLAPKNPERRGALDTHPLVREYYSQQLEEDEPEAWRQGNQRLYEHFRRETVELPETVDEMEPLFNAVACGCRAGLESDALNQVLIPRIMRGEEFYASLKHCPPSSLLAVLSKFFKDGDWSLPIAADPPDRQGLDDGEQLTVLTYSGPILVATRGWSAPEVRTVYSRALDLAEKFGHDERWFHTVKGLWIHYLVGAELDTAHELGRRLFGAGQDSSDHDLLLEINESLGTTSFWIGDFPSAVEHLERGISYFSADRVSPLMHGRDPGVMCLLYGALASWVCGDLEGGREKSRTAQQMQSKLTAFGQSYVLFCSAWFDLLDRENEAARVKAEAALELGIEQQFPNWIAGAKVLLGRIRAGEGEIEPGLALMKEGMEGWKATAAELVYCYFLALFAEACCAAGELDEGLAAIAEGFDISKRTGDRFYLAELHRLEGVLRSLRGDDPAEVEVCMKRALDVAREQHAKSLELRAATSLGSLWSSQDRKQESRELLGEVCARFDEVLDGADLRDARSLLEQL